MRGLVLRFVVAGLLALIALAVASVVSSRRAGQGEAVRDSIERTGLVAQTVFEPQLTPDLVAGDPVSVAALTSITGVLDDSMFVHHRVWTQGGRIVHSDEASLVGAELPLTDDAVEAFRTGVPVAEISDLTADENVLERRHGSLLEVYYPVRATDGTPLLLETYQPMVFVEQSARAIWWQFLPAVLVPLVLLQLIQVPLAVRLARQARADRREMLRSADEATTRERRSIAHDLHDGAVQDLAGVSLSMAALASRVPVAERADLDQLAALVNGSVESLRTLFVEIYPPDLGDDSFAVALDGLADRLRTRHIGVHVECPVTVPASLDQLRVAYRVAQEATRNVARHADASHVWIRADVVDDGSLAISVRDDGRGFDLVGHGPTNRPGHFGMRMLRDLVESCGGSVTVSSTPGTGTTISATVPA